MNTSLIVKTDEVKVTSRQAPTESGRWWDFRGKLHGKWFTEGKGNGLFSLVSETYAGVIGRECIRILD